MVKTELEIFSMLDEKHKQKYLDAPSYPPECRHFVIYEWLLNTIPDSMEAKEKLRFKNSIKSKMNNLLKEIKVKYM